jgi:hypothetical protein
MEQRPEQSTEQRTSNACGAMRFIGIDLKTKRLAIAYLTPPPQTNTGH